MQFERNIIYRPNTSNFSFDENSLGNLIIKNIENLISAGDKVMIICGLTGQKLSAKELLEKSIEISKALIAAGIRQGDVVSLISENRFEFAYVLLGTIFLNCALAPINHTYSERELAHALNLSKPKFIFTSSSTIKNIVNITHELSFVKQIIFFEDCDSPMNDITVSLNTFANPKNLQHVNFELRPVNIFTSVCLILCSSGTTGHPKGVKLSQSGVIACLQNFTEYFKKSNVGDEDIVILGLLPLYHVYGIAVLLATMAIVDGKIIMLSKFQENTFLGCIEKYRCSVLFLVPPLMVFLAKNQHVDEYDLSSLRVLLCGAAVLSKELEQSVQDRLRNSNLKIKQGYAMTEITSVLMQKDIVKPGSVGDVNPNVYAKVVDESNNAVGPNQIGELCFKGTAMMMGYIGDDEATSAIIDKDGWLHSGDIGYYDNDLQFYIVDRIKELIKWKGFQVPPAEIEALLLTHPKVKDCGVIGKPDDVAGELPFAFIVKDDPYLSEAEIVKFVSEKSSPAKRLRGGVKFIEQIPKSPAGKILRRELRTLLKQELQKSKL